MIFICLIAVNILVSAITATVDNITYSLIATEVVIAVTFITAIIYMLSVIAVYMLIAVIAFAVDTFIVAAV